MENKILSKKEIKSSLEKALKIQLESYYIDYYKDKRKDGFRVKVCFSGMYPGSYEDAKNILNKVDNGGWEIKDTRSYLTKTYLN